MDIMANGIAALRRAMKNIMESHVAYIRGAATFDIKAVRGAISYGSMGRMGGVPLSTDMREYIVRIDEVPASIGLPVDGDIIADGAERWEVFRMTGNECWRYSDPTNTIIRIYTRRVA